jgi:hypothetical protein
LCAAERAGFVPARSARIQTKPKSSITDTSLYSEKNGRNQLGHAVRARIFVIREFSSLWKTIIWTKKFSSALSGQLLIFMPDDGFKRAGDHAVHTAPAAAHIQKWRFISVEPAERIPPAGVARQAFLAYPAKVIINL